MIENEHLNNVIDQKLEEIERYEVGTEKFTNGVNALVKLYDSKNAHDRLEFEKDKFEQQIEDTKVQTKMDMTKIGIGAGTTMLTTAVYIWSTVKGFHFEEHGTITSQTFRSFFQKMNPFKR